MTRFLITVLRISEVLAQESPAKVEAALSSSFDLSLAYENIVSRIYKSNPKGFVILRWVLFAMYPLTLEQLRFAYAIEEGMEDLNPKQLPFTTFINSTLGLLVLDRESNTVRIAHSTMKDYIPKYLSEHFPDTNGHPLLARTCLTFLNFHALSNESDRARFGSGGDLSPFFEYAAFQWGHHAREAGDDEKTDNMAVKWLLSERMHQVHIVREEIQRYHFLSYAQPPSPLYEACYFGLCSTVATLLKTGQDVNALDSNGRGPLYSAVCQNRLAVIQLLFECQNLDVNIQDIDGVTPLHAASRLRHVNIVRLFLTLPTRIKLPSFLPSFLTSILRFFVSFFLQLPSNVKVNVQDNNGCTALSSAAKDGHKDIIELLLQHPDININIQDNDGWTALTRAVDGGHADTVRLLLENDDIDVPASRVGEAGFWESALASQLAVAPQGKHMSLPDDLRRQLREMANNE
jgi:hypothetical protein